MLENGCALARKGPLNILMSIDFFGRAKIVTQNNRGENSTQKFELPHYKSPISVDKRAKRPTSAMHERQRLHAAR